jgi:pimeloyl-ACP methyl ester carboxylesterase
MHMHCLYPDRRYAQRVLENGRGADSMETVRLSDGRLLAYCVHGAPEGYPVLFFHGASDSAVLRYFDDAFTAAMGVRFIGVCLPGVGGSSPSRGRRLVDWGRDVAEFADALRLESFAVAGHGAGGPHALSAAHVLPDRVRRVVLVSPSPVTSELRLRDLHASPEIVAVAWLHRLRLYFAINWVMRLISRKAVKDVHAYLDEAAFTYPADAAIYRRSSEQRVVMEESIRQGFMQNGEGIYEMVMSICGRWGFRPEEVTRPVTLFYSEHDDFFDCRMPLSLAERLPDCQAHMWSAGGHYEFMKRDRWETFLKAALE